MSKVRGQPVQHNLPPISSCEEHANIQEMGGHLSTNAVGGGVGRGCL